MFDAPLLDFGVLSRGRLFLDRAGIAGVRGQMWAKGDECTDLREETHRRMNAVEGPHGLLDEDRRAGVNLV